jgi:hypothetical protein
MPNENLFLDCAEHNQNQNHGSQLCECAEHHAETSRQFDRSENSGEALAQFDVLASFGRVAEMFPATRDEDEPYHDAQEKQRHIRKAGQLREDHAWIIQPLGLARSTEKSHPIGDEFIRDLRRKP